ncbi:NAD(P)/FAD-dependent oxidoreductase [Streptomyces sp. V1I1]|uniref:NAD(P)/FAD-dependent oxidoreductase n=1 Tax=Streptomyces sp. V1I1 TaxID=3042272 RepID=UPI002781A9DE|nr:NAD(P)/FAD-dependent oxidoreductase [Streptomyces sp. V1I1]MDQ0940131.1 NADPH-dependent 2,4-dienoyl-CoA reductase/sulfur reductase-like enzyme [Streptomyces sp. V1I1]
MTASESELYDLAVVGAGSAGLAGAVTASELGLSVALLDASAQTGGQFYRHPAPVVGAVRPEALHHDWSAYADLRRRLAESDVRHLPGHHVWSVMKDEEGGDVWAVHAVTGADGDGERPVRVQARAVLLATGAYERQLPFPGWTLPGVVGAGGAQAMLKSGLVLPGRRIVVAGSGPLLLAVASSLAAAGARVPVVVEASGYLQYARHPRALVTNPQKAVEALVHGTALLWHRVRVRPRSAVTEVHGTDRVEAVTVTRLDRDWRPVQGSGRRIECDALVVGHGLVPQIELATALGCATRPLPDGTSALALDGLQETTVRGLWAAGETGGVGGAQLAGAEGELAGVAAAARLLGRPAHGGRVRELQRRRDRMRSFADVMAATHAPGSGWPCWLTDDTDVCRCEEVTAGTIRESVEDLGARDARTVKLFTRAGMGWCQGRMCGPAVACLAARDGAADLPAERRPFAVPLPLAALAALDSPVVHQHEGRAAETETQSEPGALPPADG